MNALLNRVADAGAHLAVEDGNLVVYGDIDAELAEEIAARRDEILMQRAVSVVLEVFGADCQVLP